MKYENWNQAYAIVIEIRDLETQLCQLDKPEVTVVINERGAANTIMTIGAYKSCEHQLKENAMLFINDVKKRIENKIGMLKQELEKIN